jgi:hypothetical protein
MVGAEETPSVSRKWDDVNRIARVHLSHSAIEWSHAPFRGNVPQNNFWTFSFPDFLLSHYQFSCCHFLTHFFPVIFISGLLFKSGILCDLTRAWVGVWKKEIKLKYFEKSETFINIFKNKQNMLRNVWQDVNIKKVNYARTNLSLHQVPSQNCYMNIANEYVRMCQE